MRQTIIDATLPNFRNSSVTFRLSQTGIPAQHNVRYVGYTHRHDHARPACIAGFLFRPAPQCDVSFIQDAVEESSRLSSLNEVLIR